MISEMDNGSFEDYEFREEEDVLDKLTEDLTSGLVSALISLFKAQDFRFEKSTDATGRDIYISVFEKKPEIRNQRLICHFVDHQVFMYSYSDVNIPMTKRDEVADFITRANFSIPEGNFEMDLDAGEIRFKVVVDLTGITDMYPVLAHMLGVHIAAFETYVYYIAKICDGSFGSVREAISDLGHELAALA